MSWSTGTRLTYCENGRPDTDYAIEPVLGVFMFVGLIASVFHTKCRDA